MRFNLLADFFQGTKVDTALFKLDDAGYRQYFANIKYGKELDGITVVLMCQDPKLNLKQRIRHSKKERKLYIDIMLNMYEFMSINDEERVRIVSVKLLEEIPPIIKKYKFKDFDLLKFETDLKNWLIGGKMIN